MLRLFMRAEMVLELIEARRSEMTSRPMLRARSTPTDDPIQNVRLVA